jgi:ubiquitin C-terminal hydrolase
MRLFLIQHRHDGENVSVEGSFPGDRASQSVVGSVVYWAVVLELYQMFANPRSRGAQEFGQIFVSHIHRQSDSKSMASPKIVAQFKQKQRQALRQRILISAAYGTEQAELARVVGLIHCATAENTTARLVERSLLPDSLLARRRVHP